MTLIDAAFSDDAALDAAVSRAILTRVSKGELPPTLRLYRPGPVIAFGRQDRRLEGFMNAVGSARALGFDAVLRLVGGTAAAFDVETIAFALATPDTDPHMHTFERFKSCSQILVRALQSLGIDAHVGEVPGEYCPGNYSINARGSVKLVGIGQRVISGGAHVGGVIVVDGTQRIRNVLVGVYQALGINWNPATVGSVQEESGADWANTYAAVSESFRQEFDVEESSIEAETMTLALGFVSDHAL